MQKGDAETLRCVSCAPRLPMENKLAAQLVDLLVKLQSAPVVRKGRSAGQGSVLNKVCYEAIGHHLIQVLALQNAAMS